MITLPPAGQALVTFGEHAVPVQRLSIVDDSVSWDGDDLKVTPPSMTYRPIDLRLAKEPDPRVRAGLEALRDQLHQEPGDRDAEGAEDLPAGWRQPEPPDG